MAENSSIVTLYVFLFGIVGTARRLVGTVYVGIIQGAVTHAEYRVRPLCSSEHYRRLADNDQYADGRYVLRAVRRSLHHPYTIFGRFQTSLQRQGQSSGPLGLLYPQRAGKRVAGPKCGDAVRLETEVEYSSFHLWTKHVDGS